MSRRQGDLLLEVPVYLRPSKGGDLGLASLLHRRILPPRSARSSWGIGAAGAQHEHRDARCCRLRVGTRYCSPRSTHAGSRSESRPSGTGVAGSGGLHGSSGNRAADRRNDQENAPRATAAGERTPLLRPPLLAGTPRSGAAWGHRAVAAGGGTPLLPCGTRARCRVEERWPYSPAEPERPAVCRVVSFPLEKRRFSAAAIAATASTAGSLRCHRRSRHRPGNRPQLRAGSRCTRGAAAEGRAARAAGRAAGRPGIAEERRGEGGCPGPGTPSTTPLPAPARPYPSPTTVRNKDQKFIFT
ncbi:uncharacterized protein LOC110405921 [Numida meleagris]|uniref:uncharacterized protein LOC110405921 n=1 Tax=Numida meleagris TaxID=8996 RepID=UPI000B3DCE2B|nr:uncharacterized protein LOC110405921 [Numida meleagris]